MPLPYLLAGLVAYILAGRFIVRGMSGLPRDILFALLNCAGVYLFLFYGHNINYTARFALYLGLIVVQYTALRLFSGKTGWAPWIAFWIPILALIVVRYVPAAAYVRFNGTFGMHWRGNPDLVGISYLAFRASYLVLEVRNRTIKHPNFWQYLGFCFFLPTMPVGPINPYSNHARAFASGPYRNDAGASASGPQAIASGRAALRLLVGFVKYTFLGGILNRLTYSGLLLDDHPHHWIDLPIAILFYYLFLYCNFSGFCDVAIGAAGLMGIPVVENFNNPFAARNVKEFWNRWHITLSHWMRDVVFTPLTKYLVGVMGPKQVNNAVAIAIVVVFLLVGIWHGVGWNYAMFGAMHAFALVVNHYYVIWLKQRLGREKFKAYMVNKWIYSAAVAITFCYCACALFLFANTFAEMKQILPTVGWCQGQKSLSR
jgi:D-alanyl-lipoteichoic acid acyltransferase DltB (MBOAT superfamily)